MIFQIMFANLRAILYVNASPDSSRSRAQSTVAATPTRIPTHGCSPPHRPILAVQHLAVQERLAACRQGTRSADVKTDSPPTLTRSQGASRSARGTQIAGWDSNAGQVAVSKSRIPAARILAEEELNVLSTQLATLSANVNLD